MRKSIPRRLPLRKRNGWKTAASTQLSPRAPRRAVIARMFLTEDIDGQPGLFALLPQIVDAVRVPVIAAGGVADGRGIAAAFALGASAVQIGTAYLSTPQSTISAIHREALCRAKDKSTRLTNLFTGRPARGILESVRPPTWADERVRASISPRRRRGCFAARFSREAGVRRLFAAVGWTSRCARSGRGRRRPHHPPLERSQGGSRRGVSYAVIRKCGLERMAL